VAGLAADIVAVLLRHAASKLCDPCVAFATNSSLDRVTQVLEALTPFSEFRRFKTMCSICGGINKVTTAKVDGGTPVVSHSGLHRGWRLVVLSYRLTSCRWRPMVIMKPPRGSSLPDAGSLVRATFASKAEADRRAVRAAREWIDGHAHSGQGGQTPAGCSDVGVAEVDGRHVVATRR
jgi:hypothetical protein